MCHAGILIMRRKYFFLKKLPASLVMAAEPAARRAHFSAAPVDDKSTCMEDEQKISPKTRVS